MRIVRGPREHGFVIIPNAAVEDTALSFRARGLLAYLLSRPDGWHTDSTRLARDAVEGRDAIRTALRELEAAGYLHRQRTGGTAGQWVTVTMVTDHPSTPVDGPVDGGGGFPADAGFPGVGGPGVGYPGAASKTESKKYPPTPASGGASTICKRHRRPRKGCDDCAIPAPVRPTWCGECDEQTRLMDRPGLVGVKRCPTCHPLAVAS